MPTVFFSYYLKDRSTTGEFERQIFRDVAPRAMAEESVEAWTLHRIQSWPGGSDDAPDYICVVEVFDLELWSSDAAASIAESHGSLGASVRRVAMAVTVAIEPPAVPRR